MKTLLVPTDFSPQADNAARFAIYLAKDLNAGIQLCHVINVPEESPIAAEVAWPLDDYKHLKAEADGNLEKLCNRLAREEQSVSSQNSYHPLITALSQVGIITDVVRNLVCDPDIELVVMGLSGAGRVSRFFLGSSSRDIIEKGGFPTLLIPAQAVYQGLKKVAFATDLDADDVQRITELSDLLRPFNTEITIVHVTAEANAYSQAARAEAFMQDVATNTNYPAISYRSLTGDVQSALNSLCKDDGLDLLAVVHKRHSIYNWLTAGSHSQKLAMHTKIPLLVYPPI